MQNFACSCISYVKIRVVLNALHQNTNQEIFFLSAAKVGKTSLIMSLVSEEFPDEVTPHLSQH